MQLGEQESILKSKQSTSLVIPYTYTTPECQNRLTLCLILLLIPMGRQSSGKWLVHSYAACWCQGHNCVQPPALPIRRSLMSLYSSEGAVCISHVKNNTGEIIVVPVYVCQWLLYARGVFILPPSGLQSLSVKQTDAVAGKWLGLFGHNSAVSQALCSH